MPTENTYQSSVDVKLDYIQRDIRLIQKDIGDIKNDNISRREFNGAMENLKSQIPNETDHETRIRALETRVWKFIGALVIGQVIILPVLLYMFYKSLN